MKLDFIKKIVTSKIFHRVVCVLIILFIWYMVFSSGSICFADDWVLDAETKIRNFNEIASEIIKIAYVFLWPLIFVCWITLDNSLVYGTWLHLDAPLWSLWNIMKNIANFALWFFVLYAILRNLLSAVGLEDKKWKPIEVIKKTLISWILIQMSRFLVAAIIDVSTILTYAVWWLPFTVLQSNPQYSNKPIMSLHINASSSTRGMDYEVYYTYWEHKISDCKIVNNFPLSWSYIVWAKTPYIWNAASNTWFYVDTWYCAVWWRPYRYKHVLSWETDGFFPNIYSISDTGDMLNKTYEIQLTQHTNNIDSWTLDSLLKNCVIIPVDDMALYSWCNTWDSIYWALSLTWNDPFFVWQDGNGLLYTIDNLIEQSKGYVWPLITIYSSLLDIQSFADIWSHTSYVEDFISLMFKLLFSLVLIAPLVWLAIILVVRIWILRLVIAATPVLILIWVFGDMLWWLSKALPDQLSIWNIVKLVFAPVIITLAISLSLIFINAISDINKRSEQRLEVFDSLWIQENKDEKNTYSILWLVEIQLNTKLVNQWLDDFAYFITLLFATGIIWFFLITAIKLCGKTGDRIWEFMWQNSKTLLGSAPIIPLPSGWRVWWNALSNAPQMLSNRITTQFSTTSEQNMQESFPWLYSDTKDEWAIAYKVVERVVSELKEGKTPSLTAAQVNILSPIFGTSNEQELVSRIKTMNDSGADLKRLTENYGTYNEVWQMAENRRQALARDGASRPAWEKTSADALNLTRQELEMWVQYDAGRKEWAKWMIWWSVHTSDGVYIVDVVPGTEHSNPMYQISDREDYEKRHFGEPVSTVSKDDLKKMEADDTEKFNLFNSYINNLKTDYERLDALTKKKETQELKGDDKTLYENLDKFFESKMLESLSKLYPDGDFKKKGWEEWEQS